MQSGLGGAGGVGSPGAGWAGGCTPTAASLLFFLLFVSDFHQGPELPALPLSAMAGGPRGSRHPEGRAKAAPPSTVSGRSLHPFPGLPHVGCGVDAEAAACAGEENKTWLLRWLKSCAPPSHFLSLVLSGTGSARVEKPNPVAK